MYEMIIDLATGKETKRKFTLAEMKEWQAETERLALQQAEREAAAAKAAAAKQAILDRLGLTAEEAKMLLS